MENDKRARERDPPSLWAEKEKKLVSITTRDSISSLRNYLQVVESTRHATLLHHHVLSFVHDFLMPSSFFFPSYSLVLDGDCNHNEIRR
jgi:hypothetical protein